VTAFEMPLPMSTKGRRAAETAVVGKRNGNTMNRYIEKGAPNASRRSSETIALCLLDGDE